MPKASVQTHIYFVEYSPWRKQNFLKKFSIIIHSVVGFVKVSNENTWKMSKKNFVLVLKAKNRVPDECIFNCQRASRGFAPQSLAATFEAEKRHTFWNFFKKFFWAHVKPPESKKSRREIHSGKYLIYCYIFTDKMVSWSNRKK